MKCDISKRAGHDLVFLEKVRSCHPLHDTVRAPRTRRKAKTEHFHVEAALVNIMAIFSICSSLSRLFFAARSTPISFCFAIIECGSLHVLVSLFIRRRHRHLSKTCRANQVLRFSIVNVPPAAICTVYRVPLSQLSHSIT